jgi:hypothetical protein
MLNTHPDTGVAYGLVSSNDLDPELVDTLMYGPQAKDMSYEAGYALWLESQPDEMCDDVLEQIYSDQYVAYEPEITGTHDGVTYSTCWLGGALNFWILESPHIGEGSRPSPCVPGACILHHPESTSQWIGSASGYTVPADWWASSEVRA